MKFFGDSRREKELARRLDALEATTTQKQLEEAAARFQDLWSAVVKDGLVRLWTFNLN